MKNELDPQGNAMTQFLDTKYYQMWDAWCCNFNIQSVAVFSYSNLKLNWVGRILTVFLLYWVDIEIPTV